MPWGGFCNIIFLLCSNQQDRAAIRQAPRRLRSFCTWKAQIRRLLTWITPLLIVCLLRFRPLVTYIIKRHNLYCIKKYPKSQYHKRVFCGKVAIFCGKIAF